MNQSIETNAKCIVQDSVVTSQAMGEIINQEGEDDEEGEAVETEITAIIEIEKDQASSLQPQSHSHDPSDIDIE
eukprot:Awhi_evm1s13484